jgi:hypothetical protein
VSVTDMRNALANNLGTISGIRTYADVPDNPNMPAAVVQLQSVRYNGAFDKGLVEYSFAITVIFGRIATIQAQKNLDALISTGDRSVKAAVESDRTLAGSAYDLTVTEMTNITSVTIGDITYLTADFAVTVFGQ